MNTEPVIHVGILFQPEIEFVLNGNYSASNGKTYNGAQKASYLDGKVLFDNQVADEISFESVAEGSYFDLIDVVIGINFHWERKENQRFKGALKFIVENEKLTAINRIKVEDYLTSVISSEMSATASDELLKAHAIISRSWLLKPILTQALPIAIETPKGDLKTDIHHNKKSSEQVITHQKDERNAEHEPQNTGRFIKWYERDAHSRFDVCADDHCQRYQGITRASTKAVEDAIEATRGEVLTYANEICDARFSKSCGGISETFENCWAPEHFPYLTPVVDNPTNPEGYAMDLTIEKNAIKWIRHSPEAFCNTTDKVVLAQVLNNYDQETTDFYRWKVEYTQAEIKELLARRAGIDFGDILDLIPVKRGESGRLIELKIIGSKCTITVGKELEIRKWLSNSHLYSSAFVVDKSDMIDGIPQQFTLTGAGWGHGVGLCQIGAAVMGEKGYGYDAILLHYFRGAELKHIY